MHILVTGGAGYIGSFMVKRLLEEGYQVTVLDSLERGQKSRIDPKAHFIQANLMDESMLSKIFEENSFDGVLHFAGFISMAESMQEPSLYFSNNTFATYTLLEAMRKAQVKNIIFSSTAGVYGNPIHTPIDEEHPKNPENPYGESKRMVEQMLRWYSQIYNINFAALRYFNAAGAALDGSMGEDHDPETHIIPNIIRALTNEKTFTLYGTDYDTKDGTCVRDYIHVLDLAEAHVLALKHIMSKPGGYIFNVGTGNGYSNKEVVAMIEEVSGKKVNVEYANRRPGDAASLIADPTLIQHELSFNPQHSDLQTIVESAWKWHTKEK